MKPWILKGSRQTIRFNQKMFFVKTLGPHCSVPDRLFRFYKTIRRFKSSLKQVDVLIVRAPTPLVLLFPLLFKKKKILLYLLGDYTQTFPFYSLLKFFLMGNSEKEENIYGFSQLVNKII